MRKRLGPACTAALVISESIYRNDVCDKTRRSRAQWFGKKRERVQVTCNVEYDIQVTELKTRLIDVFDLVRVRIIEWKKYNSN